MNLQLIEEYIDIENTIDFKIKEIRDKCINPVLARDYLSDREFLSALIKSGYSNNFTTYKVDKSAINLFNTNEFIHVDDYNRNNEINIYDPELITLRISIEPIYDLFNERANEVAIFKFEGNKGKMIIGKRR